MLRRGYFEHSRKGKSSQFKRKTDLKRHNQKQHGRGGWATRRGRGITAWGLRV